MDVSVILLVLTLSNRGTVYVVIVLDIPLTSVRFNGVAT